MAFVIRMAFWNLNSFACGKRHHEPRAVSAVALHDGFLTCQPLGCLKQANDRGVGLTIGHSINGDMMVCAQSRTAGPDSNHQTRLLFP